MRAFCGLLISYVRDALSTAPKTPELRDLPSIRRTLEAEASARRRNDTRAIGRAKADRRAIILDALKSGKRVQA